MSSIKPKREVSLVGVIAAGIFISIGIIMFQNRAYVTLFDIGKSKWEFIFRLLMIKYYYIGYCAGFIFAGLIVLYNSIKPALPSKLRNSIDNGVGSLAKQRRAMQKRQYKVTPKSLLIFIALVICFILLFSGIEILSGSSVGDFVQETDTLFKGVEVNYR